MHAPQSHTTPQAPVTTPLLVPPAFPPPPSETCESRGRGIPGRPSPPRYFLPPSHPSPPPHTHTHLRLVEAEGGAALTVACAAAAAVTAAHQELMRATGRGATWAGWAGGMTHQGSGGMTLQRAGGMTHQGQGV